MALKTSFLNDREYGAGDINSIISRIVGQGVSPEYEGIEDAKTYNLDRLNDLTKAYVERGVAYQGDPALKVIKIDDGYYISPGTAFFGNGTVTEVTENEKVEIMPDRQCYVYMISDVANNTNYIKVSESSPDYHNDSNIVPLASISDMGEITDMRFYARGKLPGFQNENYGLKRIEFEIPAEKFDGKLNVLTLDLNTEHLSMLLIHTPEDETTSPHCMNALFFEGDEQRIIKVIDDRADKANGGFYLYYYGRETSSSNSYQYVILNDIKRIEGTTWELTYKAYSDRGKSTVHGTIYYV